MSYFVLFGNFTVGGTGLSEYSIVRSMVMDLDLNLGNQVFYYGGQPQGAFYCEVTGKWVSSRPFGTALFTAPFYALSLLFDHFIHYRDAEYLRLQGDVFIHSLMFTFGLLFYSILTVLIIYKISARFTSPNVAFFTGLIAFLSSPLGYYSNAPCWPSHSVETFLVALALLIWNSLRNENRPIQDVALGLAAASIATVRYSNAIFLLPFGLWYLAKRECRRFLLFLLSYGAVITFIPLYWTIEYGSPLAYGYGGSTLTTQGFTPIPYPFLVRLFNPGRGFMSSSLQSGFFVFHPVLLFSLLGIRYLIRDDPELGWMTLGLFLSITGLFGFMASGGNEGFSVRFFVCTVPALSIGLAKVLEEHKSSWKVLGLISILGFFSFVLFLQHIFALHYKPLHWTANMDVLSDYMLYLWKERPDLITWMKALYSASNLPALMSLIR